MSSKSVLTKSQEQVGSKAYLDKDNGHVLSILRAISVARFQLV